MGGEHDGTRVHPLGECVQQHPLGAAGRDQEQMRAGEVVDDRCGVQRRRDDRVGEPGVAQASCSILARSTCSGWAPTTVSTNSPWRMNSSIGMLRAS
jgi:hypothetical protein